MHCWSSSHGVGSHGSISISHNVPVYPSGQKHVNMPAGPSTHVALLKHGVNSQSSISMEQMSPVYPGSQTHVYVEFPSMQSSVPLVSHGPSGSGVQKSISVSQNSPVHPG